MNKIVPAASPPRYMQILAVLRARVEAGVYPLETGLPTESELCDEFDASRYTVREALRRLVDQGMVHRRQGSGSVVVAREPQARYVHSLSSLDGLFQLALERDQFGTHETPRGLDQPPLFLGQREIHCLNSLR